MEIVFAPGKSRPLMNVETRVRPDYLAAHERLGATGIGGLTECTPTNYKDMAREVFGVTRVPGVAWADAPLILGAGVMIREHGVDWGCKGIGWVAPVRKTAWAILAVEGFDIGGVSTHMMPGWVPGDWAQRLRNRAIHKQWLVHQANIRRRLIELRMACDAVVLMGDINRPGEYDPWPEQVRVSEPGLGYIGIWHKPSLHLELTPVRTHVQHADHVSQTLSATLTRK